MIFPTLEAKFKIRDQTNIEKSERERQGEREKNVKAINIRIINGNFFIYETTLFLVE